MVVLPIDLTAVIGIIFGSTVVLVPLIGFTARYALKPGDLHADSPREAAPVRPPAPSPHPPGEHRR
jgi:hypothetical protein